MRKQTSITDKSPCRSDRRRFKLSSRVPRGAALLLLIVAILVVVLSSTQAMIVAEVRSQQNEQQREMTVGLLRAVQLAKALDHDWESPIELPVTNQPKQVIQVSANPEKTELKALWLVNGETTVVVTRPINTKDKK